MHVALFCHKFWPAVGGLCTYTGRLAEYLVERGHDVRVFTTHTPAHAPEVEERSPRLVIRRFKTALASHPPYFAMPALLSPAAIHESRSADIIHTVGYYFFGTVYGHGISRFSGIPHVSTPVYTLNPSTWQRRAFDAAIGRRLVRRAAHVIPQSDHELELMRRDRFEMPAHTIVPFGVDAGYFTEDYDVQDLRSRHQISPGERVLLFIGKVMSPKGAFDCLEVLVKLRAAGRPLRLVMIGDVHDRERQRFANRVAELRLNDALVLVGELTDRREIARYYQLADVVLFPSQYEQFGIVAIEAAASGRPLIGTPVGIMQTIVPQLGFGLLHPFGDLDRFATNLTEVLDNPRYRDGALRHRLAVAAQYDWTSISARTERIYRAVGASR